MGGPFLLPISAAGETPGVTEASLRCVLRIDAAADRCSPRPSDSTEQRAGMPPPTAGLCRIAERGRASGRRSPPRSVSSGCWIRPIKRHFAIDFRVSGDCWAILRTGRQRRQAGHRRGESAVAGFFRSVGRGGCHHPASAQWRGQGHRDR